MLLDNQEIPITKLTFDLEANIRHHEIRRKYKDYRHFNRLMILEEIRRNLI